jgi:hypothetical protein
MGAALALPVRMRAILPLLALTFVAFAVGCDDGDEPDATQNTPSPDDTSQPSPQPGPPMWDDGGLLGLPKGALWRSDDGPILGLALNGDAVIAVTATRITSIARNGSGASTIASSEITLPNSGAIAVHQGIAYVGMGQGVWSLDLRSGARAFLGGERSVATGIAVDDAHVYWRSDDAISETSPQGGAIPSSLPTLAGPTYQDGFALVGGDLYWSANTEANGGQTAALFRLAAGSMTPEIVALGRAFSIQADERGGVAWLEEPTPVIVRHRPDGDTRIPLSGSVDEVATDGTRWFWRDSGTGVFYVQGESDATPSALTSPESMATPDDGDGRHVVLDAAGVVWASRMGPQDDPAEINELRSIPFAGAP